MDDAVLPDEKRMRLRYAGACRVCDIELPAKTDAIYERRTKTVRCLNHDISAAEPLGVNGPTDPGTPGASARREFERRERSRERRIREKHPRLGGLIHAISDEPQSTKAWTPMRSARSDWVAASTSSPRTYCAFCMIDGSRGAGPASTTWPSRPPESLSSMRRSTPDAYT